MLFVVLFFVLICPVGGEGGAAVLVHFLHQIFKSFVVVVLHHPHLEK